MKDNLIKNVLIGADPEMFLYSEQYHKFVPVCGLIGGTKKKPLPITDEGHAVQEDNVMVEYCIPPSVTLEEFLKHINFTKDYINETLLKPLDFKNCSKNTFTTGCGRRTGIAASRRLGPTRKVRPLG